VSEAQDRLEAAVHDVAVETGCIEEGEIITSWVLVGSAVNGRAADETSYFRVYPNGTLPSHVVLGLLDYAQTMERNWVLSPHDGDDE
jgi:hypothetical protein